MAEISDAERQALQAELRLLIVEGKVPIGPNAFINEAGFIQLKPPQDEPVEDIRDKRDPTRVAMVFASVRVKNPEWPAHKVADEVDRLLASDGTVFVESFKDFKTVFGEYGRPPQQSINGQSDTIL